MYDLNISFIFGLKDLGFMDKFLWVICDEWLLDDGLFSADVFLIKNGIKKIVLIGRGVQRILYYLVRYVSFLTAPFSHFTLGGKEFTRGGKEIMIH